MPKGEAQLISKPRRHSAPCKLYLQLQFFNWYPIVDRLTDLGFWITVDATRIIIIRLWTIPVTGGKKKKKDKNKSENHIKITGTAQNGAGHSMVTSEVIVPELQRGIA